MRHLMAALPGLSLGAGLLAGTVLAACAAKAEQASGLYLGAGLGSNWLSERAAQPVGATQSVRVDQRRPVFTPGFRGSFAVGYGFANGLRSEIEATALGATPQKNRSTTIGSARATGYETATGVFANVYYDFDTQALGLGRAPLGITPYIGTGIGYLHIDQKNVTAATLNGAAATVRGKRDTVASQIMVGASLPIESVPGLALTLDYRLLGRADPKTVISEVTAGGRTQKIRLSGPGATDQSVMIGVRYRFGARP